MTLALWVAITVALWLVAGQVVSVGRWKERNNQKDKPC